MSKTLGIGLWKNGVSRTKRITRLGMVCHYRRYNNGIGYEFIVKDMSLKRKYAHEWRESWEKIDTIRDVMHQFPHHEWFWWLDLVYTSP
jgi:galactosyl transferase GMA12/MNN10 family